MSIIGEVNKLAAMERDIDSIEMLIAFVSSLTVDDLAKVLPRVATKALERSSSAAEERLAISVAFHCNEHDGYWDSILAQSDAGLYRCAVRRIWNA